MFCAAQAAAGEIARVRPIGFSPDAQIFAYEEYGIQDRTGFPYASVYVLDLTRNTYLPGTPFRVRIEDDGASVARARWQVRNASETMIESHELPNNPGELVAFNPLTEVDRDPHKLRYREHATLPPTGEPNTLVLEEVPEPPEPGCEGIVDRKVSFQLRFTERNGKPVSDMVYDDEKLPSQRRCASGYRLGGVIVGKAPGGVTVEIALVAILSPGLVGQNARWIAVPVKAPPKE